VIKGVIKVSAFLLVVSVIIVGSTCYVLSHETVNLSNYSFTGVCLFIASDVYYCRHVRNVY